MVVEKFPIYGVKITGKYICESKNLICSFAHVPSKTLPKIFIITLPPPPPPPSGRRKLPIPPKQRFLKINFFLSRKGGRRGL